MTTRVLMTLMGLKIGGAETHVVELCKGLQKSGVKVFVASNGGVFEKELTQSDIRHFKVPLHNKNPLNMLKSYKMLKNIIRENHIEIVHAHARIPGFLCGLLHKRWYFKFVTTAHWVFNPGFPFNLLTNWGEASIAVSGDIKAYLMENYGIPKGRILLTINGIDTEKFSPRVDAADVIAELGLDPKGPKVVCVSRLDEDRSLAARLLVRIAPELSRVLPGVEIVIVGSGNDFDNISSLVSAANDAAGRRAVILAGARADINKFAAMDGVFVNVSRSALEAMACETPVILAGNEGYLGIFDEGKLEDAIGSNFCCRGCPPSDADTLAADILDLFGRTREDRAALGRYGRRVILENYSVDRMVSDALSLYDIARSAHENGGERR